MIVHVSTMAMTSDSRRLEVAGEEVIYEVPRLSDISSALLQKISQHHPEGKVVFRPVKPDAADLEFLVKVIPDSWFGQIGFTRESIGLDQSSLPPVGELILRSPKSQSEVELVLARTFHPYGLAPWQSYIGDQRVQDWTRMMFSVATTKNTGLVTLSQEVVATVITFPYKDCLGTPRTHIGWVWVDKNLSSGQRQEAHRLLFQHLKEMGPGPFQAGVHLKNVRSQRFFSKYEFIPQCIHLYY